MAENDPFKNAKEIAGTVIGITLLIILVICFVFGAFFAGVFAILGVHYESIWSLAIYAVSFFVLGFFIELLFDVLAKFALENITGTAKSFIVQMFFGFISNWLVLFTVDEFMESITLSLKAKIIIAFLLGLLDPLFDDKKKGKDVH